MPSLMGKARPVCPRCRSDRIAPVAYGPATPDAVEAVQAAVYNDAIMVGGGHAGDDARGWRCRSCGHSWGDPKAVPQVA
jgi:transposase-like protein